MREEQRVGLQYVECATELLRRVRKAHATSGSLEAADIQWWWRSSRPTDEFPQLFWFDTSGHPEAGVITTDWGDGVALDPIVLPGASPQWTAQVVERGLAHAKGFGFESVEVVADERDAAMLELLGRLGFVAQGDDKLSIVEAWLDADARPEVTLLRKEYSLSSRVDTAPAPHHLSRRNGPEVESRLRQTSLYRPDLDLVVQHEGGDVAAYGLFWFDPETRTGLVEPMRTEEDHQKRGLARHVLTSGVDRLSKAGAERIKVCFHPTNPAAKGLYESVGFEPLKQTVVLCR